MPNLLTFYPWIYRGQLLGFLSPLFYSETVENISTVSSAIHLETERQLNQFVASVQECFEKKVGKLAPMEEYITVRDNGGQPIIDIPRALGRWLGVRMEFVRLIGCTKNGNIILAQRADNKKIAPGKWEHLVGGAVAAQELPYETFLREASEEAGLTASQLLGLHYLGYYYFTDVDVEQKVVLRDLHHLAMVSSLDIEALCNLDGSIQCYAEIGSIDLIQDYQRQPTKYLQDFGLTLPFLSYPHQISAT